MSAFEELERIPPARIWDSIVARPVEGERATLAVIELDPNSVVPEHTHDNEQLGVCLAGSMVFRVGGEEREVTSGSTWSIPSNVPHDVTVGPEGCVVAEVFVPRRDDWDRREREDARAPRWP